MKWNRHLSLIKLTTLSSTIVCLLNNKLFNRNKPQLKRIIIKAI